MDLPSVFSLAMSGGFFGLPIIPLFSLLLAFDIPPPEGLGLDFEPDLEPPPREVPDLGLGAGFLDGGLSTSR